MSRKQQLLKKYLHGQCGTDELQELFDYLRKESSPEDYDPVIQQLWHTLRSERALLPQESETLYQQIDAQLPSTPYPVWRIAAGISGLLLGVVLVYLLVFNKQVSYTADFGQTRTVVLPDQSTVVLNANSTLHHNSDWDGGRPREVWLEGEAYFSVQHLANAQTFTVYTQNMAIKVLGTEFNVQHRRGNTRVTLDTGSILLNAQGSDDKRVADILMKPGEQAVLTSEYDFTLASIETTPVTAWINHELVFDNTPLVVVIQTIEDIYGYPVIIESDSIRQLKLTGILPNNNLNTVLGLLQETFSIKSKRENGIIRLRL